LRLAMTTVSVAATIARAVLVACAFWVTTVLVASCATVVAWVDAVAVALLWSIWVFAYGTTIAPMLASITSTTSVMINGLAFDLLGGVCGGGP